MKEHTKISVIGGTGKSGKYLCRLLQQQKLSMRMLVRDAQKEAPLGFSTNSTYTEVVEGNALDENAVAAALQGCQAVISTLGLSIPPSEPTLFSQATANILQAMKMYDIARYIVTTGLNVDTPQDHKGEKTQLATDWMYQHYPVSTADRQLEYQLLKASDVNWTLVRLPLIEETDQRYGITASLTDCPGAKVSATDLADFLLAQLSDTAFLQQAPFVASI